MYFGQPKQLQAGRDADELGDDVAEIRDQNSDHHQECDTETEFLADQVAEAFPVTAPMRAVISWTTIRARVMGIMVHSREMSELRAGRRVGPDAAGIVIDVRGNKPRTDYCEEQQDPGLPASQKLHGHFSQTYG